MDSDCIDVCIVLIFCVCMDTQTSEGCALFADSSKEEKDPRFQVKSKT